MCCLCDVCVCVWCGWVGQCAQRNQGEFMWCTAFSMWLWVCMMWYLWTWPLTHGSLRTLASLSLSLSDGHRPIHWMNCISMSPISLSVIFSLRLSFIASWWFTLIFFLDKGLFLRSVETEESFSKGSMICLDFKYKWSRFILLRHWALSHYILFDQVFQTIIYL